MRRAVVFASFVIVAACSSEEQLNPQPLPPEDQDGRATGPGGGSSSSGGTNGGASLGSCDGTCCDKPAEGSACDSTADTTCSWAVTCQSGLVIPYTITCTSGAWALTDGCPEPGTSDSRGCPASNPENNTPCSQGSNGFVQCGYVLDCKTYRKSVQATCNGTTWQSTALGTCD